MPKPPARFIFVRHEKRNLKIEFSDIQYIEACKNYGQIVTTDKRFQVLGTLGHVTSFDTHHAWVAGQQVPIGDACRGKLNRFILFPEAASHPTPRKTQHNRASQLPE
jgi:hypothetical protein